MHLVGFIIRNFITMHCHMNMKFGIRNGVPSMNVGPCHHGMARPRVVDGVTASNMEGSCE